MNADERQARALERLVEIAESRADDDQRIERIERAPRRPLHHMGVSALFRAMPALAGEFRKEVPGEFWSLSGAGEATVACPCGKEPVVEVNAIEECECDRFFCFTGESVRVARYEGWKDEPRRGGDGQIVD